MHLFVERIEAGDVFHDGKELSNGWWMTRQVFWLNSEYVLGGIMETLA